ncbi:MULTISPECIES: hypothetical protein [unclassified Sphingomonas]|uniref:hypothetical protein n=1 Tax=unclassified Sphingomonas TaxID=196159 RepID=UPI0006F801D8|nr:MULTISPECIES: hypothetical protein [unclassified Sphingomonas]KQM28176.1 hypothetical protein ASE58_07745 [Sphingomonas sp. Leaf9]KQM44518.1 hypothetical protein ASE57_07740 [Sphingomonas sp. Leaf11]
MTAKFALAMAALLVGAGSARAQIAPVGGAPSSSPNSEDTTHSVNNDRDQQFALDKIRDEAGTTVDARASRRSSRNIVAATAADLTVGASVFDKTGVALGTIEAVKPEGVQLLAGASRAMVPAEVFGKVRGKLVLNVTKAELAQQTGAGAR